MSEEITLDDIQEAKAQPSVLTMAPGEELLGSEIKAYVKFERMIFPKGDISKFIPGSFAILNVNLVTLLEGTLPEELNRGFGATKPDFSRLPIVGLSPRMEPGVIYFLRGTLTEHQKFGLQYKIEELHKVNNITTHKEKEDFIRLIYTEKQAEWLINNFVDPYDVLKRGDMESLVKIKGIGESTAQKLLEVFAKNAENAGDMLKLAQYNLTPNQIAKMGEVYKSIDTIDYMIKHDPYDFITTIPGIGWEKADAIAITNGMPPNSEERIAAYINYYLKKQATDIGHIWVPLEELCAAVDVIAPKLSPMELLGMLQKWIGKVPVPNFEPWLYYSDEGKKIGLKYYRVMEEEIARELIRIQQGSVESYSNEEIEQVIKEAEEECGFTYTDEQREGIKACFNNNIVLIVGAAGCVDCDTEYFNGTEWKRIADYTEGDKVLQYNPDGSAELVIPEAYVKYPEKTLYACSTKYGLDMCLSKEHNVYYITSKGNLYHKSWGEIIEAHNNSMGGFSGKFITTFNTQRKGIPLSDVEIKLMLAVIADGSFYTKNPESMTCRFHIKKDRKKQALLDIFKEGNYQYRMVPSATEGYTDFYVEAPRREKEFTEFWYDASPEQLQLIADNVLQWDGSKSKGRQRFSTTIKESADFIQYVFTACGQRAVITERDRSGQKYFTYGKYYTRKSKEYNVNITNRSLISMGGFHQGNDAKTQIVSYETKDGFKYCFTVPTHMWVMRRNGKIVVTGNTGKSSTVKPVTMIMKQRGQRFKQCALSGKASSNLEEMTGETGQTIHRLLGLGVEDSEAQKQKEKKEIIQRGEVRHSLDTNMILVDELSMVDDKIFLKLLRAVPTGGRLICLGDIQQLECIGVGAVCLDMLSSPLITTCRLNKIHRQAARSGIITESLKISAGEPVISHTPTTEVRGELADLKVRTYTDSVLSQQYVMEEYQNLLDMGISPKDIGVIVPLRERGAISCYELNAIIQDKVNPAFPGEKEATTGTIDKPYTLRKRDKIIITRNHYKECETVEKQPIYDKNGQLIDFERADVPIFNGNIGYVKDISDKEMIVDLTIQGEVVIPKKFWHDVSLGYAVTCHKFQGSACPYIIVGLDMSAYALLCKEWLYTAITRARKYCVLVTQINAARQAIATSHVLHKRTWLQELLPRYKQEWDEKMVEGNWNGWQPRNLLAYLYRSSSVHLLATKGELLLTGLEESEEDD